MVILLKLPRQKLSLIIIHHYTYSIVCGAGQLLRCRDNSACLLTKNTEMAADADFKGDSLLKFITPFTMSIIGKVYFSASNVRLFVKFCIRTCVCVRVCVHACVCVFSFSKCYTNCLPHIEIHLRYYAS